MLYYRQRLHSLQRKLHNSEVIDRGCCSAVCSGSGIRDRRRAAHRVTSLSPEQLRGWMLWGLALVPVYAAIFEIYLNEKADAL